MSFDASRLTGLPTPPQVHHDAPRESPFRVSGSSFADTLGEYLRGVTEMQHEAESQVQALTSGDPVDPHRVMLAVEEANLALDLLLEIRNRLMETYQELTRTAL